MTAIFSLACYTLLILVLAVLVGWEYQRMKRERRKVKTQEMYEWRSTIKSRI